jgi:hypothetical protein
MLIKDLVVEADHFTPGKCIEVTAKGIRLGSDFGCRAASRAFEESVFDEVSQTMTVESFVPGTRAQEDAKAD